MGFRPTGVRENPQFLQGFEQFIGVLWGFVEICVVPWERVNEK